MTASRPDQTFLDQFHSLEKAFPVVTLGYLALKTQDATYLISAKLICRTDDEPPKPVFVETKNIIAGFASISDLGLEVADVIRDVLNGKLKVGDHELIFPGKDGGLLDVSYVGLHPDGTGNQSRLNVLRVNGANRLVALPDRNLDWELMAASKPYESLMELAADVSLLPVDWEICMFEAAIPAIAAIEYASEVAGNAAKPRVRLRNRLDKTKVSIGYRVFVAGGVVERGSIASQDIKWTEASGNTYELGVGEIAVPASSVIQCFAVYDGITQHFGWISDGTVTQNPRRAALELADPNLVSTEALLKSEPGKGNSRDLEAAVSWILWLLGFNPIHLGATTVIQNAVDALVHTPAGNFLVIECTTGMIRPDNKLSQLVGRTTETRKRLVQAGIRYPRILSVMATSRPRDEVAQDLEYAEKLGVLVLAREDLLSMLNGTLTLRDPDRIFAEAEKQVQLLRAKHES